MKQFNADQLAAMKPQFIAYLETDWCDCKSLRERFPEEANDDYWTDAEHKLPDGSPCNCYGRDEFDDVELATINDDNVTIHYHGRTLTLPVDGFEFITCGDLQWVGDDCDYYGAIVHWLATLR